MSNHSSARPHTINSINNQTVSEALKQRAQSVINDKSVDTETRALIRYALEINDPTFAKLVRRAGAGEAAELPPTSVEKIEALAEIICGGRNEAPAALMVLMAILEDSSEPQALAHAAKHFVFTRCGELNLFDMVNEQTALFESKLLGVNSPVS